MNGRQISGLSIVVLTAAWGWFATADAASPWANLLMSSRVDADPQRQYQLTEDNGPWMIMACSFSGEGAAEQARELALELRKRYKLPAYTHPMRFDFGDAQGRGIDQFGAPLKLRYKRGSELQEYAVLVGNYQAVDDPDAQKTLAKLKYSTPKCLELDEGRKTHQSLAALRIIHKHMLAAGSRKKEKGPMGHAFVTTNPKLPKDYFSAPGVDSLVLKMNDGIRYSLLDCPGKYTVQVRNFKGAAVLNQGDIRAIEDGKPMRSSLDEAGDKATDLVEALRIKGYEAYVFHDRYASIVTVGSFDSVGAKDADGQIVAIDPAVRDTMRFFGAKPSNLPGRPSGAIELESVIGIYFDVQPKPIRVPKRSISRALARGMF